VRIAGVLLVFSYLIVPAVCGINLVAGFGRRMLVGCVVSLLGGIGGLFASFWWDLPTGAAIVTVFGALLIAVTVWTWVRGPIAAGEGEKEIPVPEPESIK
jgi:zinc/manganese transport system permease protein